MSASRRVFVACDDMFFRVNLEARIRTAGLEPVGVDSLEAVNDALAAGAPRAAFVDLHLRGQAAVPIIDRLAISRPGMPIISFGSHLDSDLLDSARRAGAVALPRSRFDREFATLLSKISVGVLTTPLQSPPSQETSE
jgi:DNA-binding NtrC family response regulator